MQHVSQALSCTVEVQKDCTTANIVYTGGKPYHIFRKQQKSSSLSSLPHEKTLAPLGALPHGGALHHPLFLEVSFCRCFLLARIKCSHLPLPCATGFPFQ